MREIAVSNCVFDDCRDGLKIQCSSASVYENITFANIAMRDVWRPVFMTATSYAFSEAEGTCRPRIGSLRRLLFSNISAILPGRDRAKEAFDYPCFVVSGLPGHLIEDVTFDSLSMVFPGGGTGGMARRVDVPELLDFTELWPETMHFNGPLPASCVMLRHAKRLVFRNVSLTVAEEDGRPFLFCDDLVNADFGGIRGFGSETAPGLMKLVDCRDTQVLNCALRRAKGQGPVQVPLTKDEKGRHDLFREASVRLDRTMEDMARVIDRSDNARAVAVIRTGEWSRKRDGGVLTYEAQAALPGGEQGKKVYLSFACVWGCLRVWVNGEEAGELAIPAGYRWKYYWALDITGKARPGAQNSIRVVAEHFAEVILAQEPNTRHDDLSLRTGEEAILQAVEIRIGD